MIPRRQIDIGWLDLLAGIRACLWRPDRQLMRTRVERDWSRANDCLACLSVRSGFDLLLQALVLPPGSEILVSAVTIPDVLRIIEHHGLIPVPVDLDMATLAPRVECLEAAVSSATRAILVAHLFGSVIPLDSVVEFARRHALLMIEDCAQAYAGAEYRGHAGSDVQLWSFGPIKTSTALGGAVLVCHDQALLDRISVLQAAYPTQSTAVFVRRLGKYALLKLLGAPALFGVFVACCRWLGASHDTVIRAAVRGFAGPDLLAQLRQQPCAALLALLSRRLRENAGTRILCRRAIATTAIKLMPDVQRPGSLALQHSHWVFPIYASDPARLARRLWQAGFDATSHGASLQAVPAPRDRLTLRPVEAERALEQLVYLPIYPGVPAREIRRLARIVGQSIDWPKV